MENKFAKVKTDVHHVVEKQRQKHVTEMRQSLLLLFLLDGIRKNGLLEC